MRPILFTIGHYFVASYSAMMFIAVVAAVGSAMLRVRRVRLDGALVAKGMTIAIVAGWLAGRVGLWLDGTVREAGMRILSPTYPAPGSLTYFLTGVCAGLVVFAALAGKRSVDYFDALAPSTFVAVAFAKIGCLLGGCCAGAVCPASVGIAYPYGSPAYELQYRTGAIAVPAPLLRPGDPSEGSPFWGEYAIMAMQPEIVADRVVAAGLPRASAAAVVEAARGERSLPVWPVPVAVSVASFLLWIAAEVVFRRSQRPGVTVAFVLSGYGLLRLVFDWFIAQRGAVHAGMSLAQWVGLAALLAGVALFAQILLRRQPVY